MGEELACRPREEQMLVNTASLVEAAFRGVGSTDLLKQEVDEATVRAKYGARARDSTGSLGRLRESELCWMDAGTVDNEQKLQ